MAFPFMFSDLSLRVSGQKLFGTFFLGRINDLFGITLFYDYTAVHKYNLVGHIAGKGHLVRNNDHRRLFLRQAADYFQYLTGQLRIQRGGRFIKA